jgi:membrane-associated phospholipid phosphatase
MALFTIRPTRLDCTIADFAEDHATPQIEAQLQGVTYAADEHVLFAVSLGLWLLSRRMGTRQRRAASYLALNVAVSALLPHALKALVDQERPDRRVHGRRQGIPVSGKAYDAFPSGHAVHVAAVASAISRYFPRWKRFAWTLGGGVAISRILLLAHWTTDVLAGLALGAALERGLWACWPFLSNLRATARLTHTTAG